MTVTKAADHAYEFIRLQILDGTLHPGDRLVEADLADDLRSSRTPVREALRRLEAEGLVEVLPHRGARVAAWTEDDLREIYDLRAVLESMAGERAATHINDGDLNLLDELCNEMEACMLDSSPTSRDRYSQLNGQYHDVIRDASGSPRLVSMLRGVVSVPLIVTTFHRYQQLDMARSARHHREIVEALRAGDGIWAGSVLRAHVLAAKSTLLQPASPRPDGRPD